MISNTNPSTLCLTQEEFDTYATGLSDTSSVRDTLSNLQERRDNAVNGGANCIPWPLKRFRSEVPGTEQGQYVVITATMKTGKTQAANYLYVFNTLDYCFENPDKCTAHIIYIPLEESVQKIIERYMCYLLYKLDGIRVAPSDLRSTSSEFVIEQEILDKFETKPYKDRLDFFEKCVQFETEDTNPTGILRVCEEYAKSVGTYKSHKIESRGNSFEEVEVFDSYVQDDPNHYKIVVIDHIGLVDKERGFRTKDAVDKMSEYMVKYLRNRYNYTCVVIQQQASDSEGLEAIKMKKMKPSTATLGDSKYTARDCDLALGLFDPSKFGLTNYGGYKIYDAGSGDGLKNYGRFMEVLANRNGEMGGVCPLFFDGATCTFEELPRPDDLDVQNYYDKAQNLKTYRQNRKLRALKGLVMTFLLKLKHK